MSALPFGTRVRVLTTRFDKYGQQSGAEGVVVDAHQDMLNNHWDIVVRLDDVYLGTKLYSYKGGDVERLDIRNYHADQIADDEEDLL